MSAKFDKYRQRAQEAGERGNFGDAEDYWWLALREAEDAQSVQLVCMSLDGLADAFMQENRYAEAESLYRESLAKKIAVLGKDHAVVGRACNSLGHVLYKHGKSSEAETYLRQAFENLKESVGLVSPEAQWSGRHLAQLLKEMKRDEEATRVSRVMQELKPKEQQSVTGSNLQILSSSSIQAICEICLKQYKGPQCLRCTQRGMATLRGLESAPKTKN